MAAKLNASAHGSGMHHGVSEATATVRAAAAAAACVSDLVVSQLVGGADGAQCTGLLDIEHLHSVRVVGCSTRPRKKETWQEVQLRIS
jgi:hypothetical protein